MQSFFWHVLAQPRVYAAIVAEITSAVSAGTFPATGNPSWNESQALLYFQAALKEAMRIRPAVGLNITRLVPPEGVELDGHFFPGGTSIAINGWVLHRDKDVFGQDADVFRPERWLEDPEDAKRMERYMFQVGTSELTAPFLSVRRIFSLTISTVRRWEPPLHRP
jgi:cytochrome P450